MAHRTLLLTIACLFLGAASGCQGDQAANSSSELLAVPVSRPVEREVTNYEDFTGRTDAIHVVDLRARVTGYLLSTPFREGAEVRQGDILFEIDPGPYKAQYDQAISQVTLNEASLKLAKSTYERDLAAGNSVSPQQLDQDKAAVDEAVARLNASKASTEVYKLNLDFTHVKSPIDGEVSRYYMTRGNLVQQDTTLLTTLVSLDPMYAYFDLDEPSLLRIRRAIIEGRINLPEAGTLPVFMGLSGEDGFPHEGKINFRNNQVNSATGSISMRGVFDNPKLLRNLPSLAASTVGLLPSAQGLGGWLTLTPFAGTPGTRLLAPGMFVRIRFPIGKPYTALLVIDQAILSDQGLKYVYVVDKDNKVERRPIKTGALQEDGLRVIQGVKADERIVVNGLQQVRPKMEVKPEEQPMQTFGGQGAAADKGSKGQGDKGKEPKQP